MLQELFNKVADMRRDSSQRLLAAAVNGKDGLCEKLLVSGADPDAGAGTTRGSCLIQAAAAGHTSVLRVLVSHKASIDLQDYSQRTALHETIVHGHQEAARFLLEAGANPNSVDRSGNSPLATALQYNYPGLALALVQAGADASPPWKDSPDKTLKEACAAKGWTDVAAAVDKRIQDVAAAAEKAALEARQKKENLAAEIEAAPVLQNNLPVSRPFTFKTRA